MWAGWDWKHIWVQCCHLCCLRGDAFIDAYIFVLRALCNGGYQQLANTLLSCLLLHLYVRFPEQMRKVNCFLQCLTKYLPWLKWQKTPWGIHCCFLVLPCSWDWTHHWCLMSRDEGAGPWINSPSLCLFSCVMYSRLLSTLVYLTFLFE